jgi:hypothetical protein
VLAATINGTTYCGIRARTTGAPQNHWFGPAGDPRAAGKLNISYVIIKKIIIMNIYIKQS